MIIANAQCIESYPIIVAREMIMPKLSDKKNKMKIAVYRGSKYTYELNAVQNSRNK